MLPVILFVDDDPHILRALKRVFYKSQYQTMFLSNGKEALEIVENQNVDVIMSDVRMPVMDGLALFRKVKIIQPETIRLFLSGYAESGYILNAMNDNLAQAFIYKPWDNTELLNLISSVISLRDDLKKARMFKCINELEQIPTLSDYYLKIEKALKEDENASVIASYLEEDPALTTRLLKLANSAYYGRKTSNVERAIILVGADMLKKLVLTQQIMKYCDNNSLTKTIWDHALMTTRILERLTKHFNVRDEHQLISMGVLHSIGIIFLLSIDKDAVMKVAADESEKPVDEKFEDEFGLSHTLVGSYLLNWWQMPMAIYECARYYPMPSQASQTNRFLITLVHIASHFAWKTLKFSNLNHSLDMPIIDRYEIDIAKIETIITSELIEDSEGEKSHEQF